MAGCIMKTIMNTRQLLSNRRIIARFGSLWTPDYLALMKPKIAEFPPAYVIIQGWDFPILEKYQQLIHTVALNMELEVEDSYAVPAKDLKVQKYKPRTSTVYVNYTLHFYERRFHISKLSASKFPIFIRMLEAALPSGVTLTIEEWNQMKEERRYIPDKELLDLKAELEDIQKPKK